MTLIKRNYYRYINGLHLISWKALRTELRFSGRRKEFHLSVAASLLSPPACLSWQPTLQISDVPNQLPWLCKPDPRNKSTIVYFLLVLFFPGWTLTNICSYNLSQATKREYTSLKMKKKTRIKQTKNLT